LGGFFVFSKSFDFLREIGYTIFVLEKGKYVMREINLPKKKTRSNGSFSVIGTDGEFF
jgi:hypothetical protein